ncbi:MAG: SLBB domain-containing protein [Planctomycetota bacterium]|nr:SLBB domain-containing protein [Planctomycetota bacterium]
MSRSFIRKTLVGLTLALGVALTPTSVAAQVPNGLAAPVGNFFGVLGEVNRGGVYEFTEASPLLVDVIRQAGGLTRFANQNVRIVRSGRSGHQAFVTPSTDFMLLPGDVVIADSAQRRATRDDDDVGEINNLPPVSIALVGVLDRPVVVTVKGAEATLGGLLQFLGQSGSLVSQARVIATARASRNTPVTNSTTRLKDSSVVVLNPRDVDRRRVPALPPAFQRVSIAAMHSQLQYPGRQHAMPQPIPVPYPVGQTQHVPYPPQPLSASAIPTLLPTPIDDETDVDSPPGRAGITDSIPGRTYMGALDGNQGRVYQPVPGQIRPETVIPLPTVVAIAPPPTTVATPPTLMQGSPIQTASDQTSRPSESVGPELSTETPAATVAVTVPPTAPVAAEKSQSDVPMIVLYLAMVGLLVIGVLLLAMVRTEPPTKPTTATVPLERKRELLERLIRNELPILEEPPQMPTKLEFFGRANGGHTLRMDQPHPTLAGPHFNRRPTVRAATTNDSPSNLRTQRKTQPDVPQTREPSIESVQANAEPDAPPQRKQQPAEVRAVAEESPRRRSLTADDAKKIVPRAKPAAVESSAAGSPARSPEPPKTTVDTASFDADVKRYEEWLAEFRRSRSSRSKKQLAQIGNALNSENVVESTTAPVTLAEAADTPPPPSVDSKSRRRHRIDHLHADFGPSRPAEPRRTPPSFSAQTETEAVQQPAWTDDARRAETGVLERVLMSVHGGSERDEDFHKRTP